MLNLRDLLYFDFEKASSIWSQLQWGQLEKIAVTSEESGEQQVSASLGIPKIAEAKLQIGEGEKRTIIETRILHHDLLNRIEVFLSSVGLIYNLTESLSETVSFPEKIREAIGQTPYVVAEGWSIIEDYQRILSIAEKFNDLTTFISKAAVMGVKESPEYLEISRQIEESRDQLKTIKDRNQKAIANRKLNELEKTIDQMLESQIEKPDDWILDGIKLWINTFLPTRINFRIYPFPECPSFQILCNLKRDSFVDQDLEHLLYGYSTRPNIPLSIFGLITSIPPESNEQFDPLSEFNEQEELSNEMSFEKAMREMFNAMDGLENFSRYSRYPNITVHPIAVYREFTLPENPNQP